MCTSRSPNARAARGGWNNVPLPALALLLLLSAAPTNSASGAALERDAVEVRARHPEGTRAGTLIANVPELLRDERPELADPDALQVRRPRALLRLSLSDLSADGTYRTGQDRTVVF